MVPSVPRIQRFGCRGVLLRHCLLGKGRLLGRGVEDSIGVEWPKPCFRSALGSYMEFSCKSVTIQLGWLTCQRFEAGIACWKRLIPVGISSIFRSHVSFRGGMTLYGLVCQESF